MKAMILAAGRGERLRPLTDKLPKPLFDVGGKALIAWHIDRLRDAGITDIVINTAWLDHMIHAALADGSSMGVSLQYSDEGEALETAGGIANALALLGDEPFLVINGDIWCDYDIAGLPVLPNDKLAHLVLVDNPAHNPEGDFSIVDGLLSNSTDKRLTFSGIGVYQPALFSELAPGKHPLAPLLRTAADQGQITAEHHPGTWTDVGTVERLQELRQQLGS